MEARSDSARPNHASELASRSRAFSTGANAHNSDQGGNDINPPAGVEGDLGRRNKKSGQKRVYRPGMNSYLKVVLDDATINRLHDCAVRLQNQVQQMSRDKKEASEEKKPAESQSKRNRDLKFKPRSRNSLHTTFFFGGEVLCELPPEELEEWHANISNRLKESKFLLTTTQPSDESAAQVENEGVTEEGSDNEVKSLDGEYKLTLMGFSLFPPRRNNLIVALMEASPSFHALHDDLRDIARDGGSEALAEIVKRSKERWTPHITLGNLYGGSKKDLRELSTSLDSFGKIPVEATSERGSSEQNADDMKVQKISMGGPVPEQIKLDWDFVFVP